MRTANLTRCQFCRSDFRRLGLRVAAMLISPWVDKGSVIQEPQQGPSNTSQWEHSSISATLTGLFNLSTFLTKRDEWAGSFEELLREAPRTDAPMHFPEAPTAQATSRNSPRRLRQQYMEPTEATARHCSASEPTCRAKELMSVKQQRSMWLMAKRTQTTLPPKMETMTSDDAEAWLRDRWAKFVANDWWKR